MNGILIINSLATRSLAILSIIPAQVKMIFSRTVVLSIIIIIILSHSVTIAQVQYPARATTASLELKPRPSSQTRPEESSTMTTSMPRRSTDSYWTTAKVTEIKPSLSPPNASPLRDSDCFCSYDVKINLLSCSPSVRNFSAPSSYKETPPLINITFSDCTFSNNRFNLPNIDGQEIDHLHLYDINRQDYLVFDHTSFASYRIQHIYIYYTFVTPITMLLLSNETFSSPSIGNVLRTLHIDSCYLLSLYSPFRHLRALQSITLIDIEQFSWYDLHQQIRSLPQLRWIYIGDEIQSNDNEIANTIACRKLPAQWILSYRSIQTCGCEFVALMNATRPFGALYQCINSSNTIDFLANVCRANGKVYEMTNRADQFCQRCLSYRCSTGTVCSETFDSPPKCLPLSRYDYDLVRQRIPITSVTRRFHYREGQEYLAMSANKTLDPVAFNTITSILIDSNRNRSESSPTDAQLFHQTLAEMLSRPWSSEIFASSSAFTNVWQNLLISLDESVKTINDSDPRFEFQSKPISTLSLRFPTDQQLQEKFGWKIGNDNKITGNISQSQTIESNTSSRAFLNFDHGQQFKPTCNPR